MSNQNQTIDKLTDARIAVQKYIFKFKKGPISKEYLLKPSSAYGYRELINYQTGGTRTSNHLGFDIVGTWHCPIEPIGLNGEVIDVYPPPDGYYRGHEVHGGYVRIRHDDGWVEGHSHLSAIYVKEGDILKDGIFYRDGKELPSVNLIGRQGNTGQSSGDHDHFSLENEFGEFVDPILYVDFWG